MDGLGIHYTAMDSSKANRAYTAPFAREPVYSYPPLLDVALESSATYVTSANR